MVKNNMTFRPVLEGFKNILRSFWLSATAVSVLTVNLASIVIVITLSTFLGYSVRNLDNLISIPAFIQDSYSEDKVPNLIDKIKSISEVKSVEYFDKDKAAGELTSSSSKVDLSNIKNSNQDYKNLVWRFVLVTPKSSEDYKKVIAELKSSEFDGIWKEVVGDENFVDKLVSFYSWIRTGSIFLIIVFVLISVLVMVNILRMTIYNHKDEIEIMRLVGATNNYIRTPFVVEGIMYSFLAAVVVSVVFISSFYFLLPTVGNWVAGGNSSNLQDLSVQIYSIFGLTMFMGTLLGGVTSYTATTRYLNL